MTKQQQQPQQRSRDHVLSANCCFVNKKFRIFRILYCLYQTCNKIL